MAVVPSDLVRQWFTELERLFLAQFNQSVAVEWTRLEPLIMEIPLGHPMGNTVQFDWLDAAPQMRRWVDEKQAFGIGEHNWPVRVKRYEAAMDVAPRNGKPRLVCDRPPPGIDTGSVIR